MIKNLLQGERVYLTPTLYTAPREAYQYAACDVLDVFADRVRLRVISSGAVLETYAVNVRRTPPGANAIPRPRPASPGSVLTLPDGCEQPELF
jgi:hypothetical protein